MNDSQRGSHTVHTHRAHTHTGHTHTQGTHTHRAYTHTGTHITHGICIVVSGVHKELLVV